MAKYYQNDQQQSEQQRFQCNNCDRYFSKESSLKQHMHTHNDTAKPYICETCNRAYTKQTSLSRHRRYSPKCKKEGLNHPPPYSSNSESTNDITNLVDQTIKQHKKTTRFVASSNDVRRSRADDRPRPANDRVALGGTRTKMSDLYIVDGPSQFVKQEVQSIEQPIDQTSNKLRKTVGFASSADDVRRSRSDYRTVRTPVMISDLKTTGGSAKFIEVMMNSIEGFENSNSAQAGDNGNAGDYNRIQDQQQLIQEQPPLRCEECCKEFKWVVSLRRHINVHGKRYLCQTCLTICTTRQNLNRHRKKSPECQKGERLTVPPVNSNNSEDFGGIKKSLDRWDERHPTNGQFAISVPDVRASGDFRLGNSASVFLGAGVQDTTKFWNSFGNDELSGIDLSRNRNDFAEGFNIRSEDPKYGYFDNHSRQIRPVGAKDYRINELPKVAATFGPKYFSDDRLNAPEYVETPGLYHSMAIPPTLGALGLHAPLQRQKSKSSGEINVMKRYGFTVDEMLNSEY